MTATAVDACSLIQIGAIDSVAEHANYGHAQSGRRGAHDFAQNVRYRRGHRVGARLDHVTDVGDHRIHLLFGRCNG